MSAIAERTPYKAFCPCVLRTLHSLQYFFLELKDFCLFKDFSTDILFASWHKLDTSDSFERFILRFEWTTDTTLECGARSGEADESLESFKRTTDITLERDARSIEAEESLELESKMLPLPFELL